MSELACLAVPRPLRVFIVRHGETEWNAAGRMQGRSDVPLSERGVLQSAAVAKRLSGEPVSAVYSSRLSRARATAEAIAEPHGLRVLETDLLTETDLGGWEGMTDAELLAKGEGAALARYRANPVRYRPPGAESLEQVAERMTTAMHDIARRHAGETVVVVGHGGSLRVLFCLALGVAAIPSMLAFRLDNGSVSLVEHTPQRSWIWFTNDTCHLANLDGIRP